MLAPFCVPQRYILYNYAHAYNQQELKYAVIHVSAGFVYEWLILAGLVVFAVFNLMR